MDWGISMDDGLKNDDDVHSGIDNGRMSSAITPNDNRSNNVFSPLKSNSLPSDMEVRPKLAIIEIIINGNTVICIRLIKPSPMYEKKLQYSPRNSPEATPANRLIMIFFERLTDY